MTDRDELAKLIQREYIRATDRKRPQDCWDAPADAILAAGYRKPRIIDTADELDELPEGSIVLDSEPDVLAKKGSKWISPKYADDSFQSRELDFPVTLISIPEAS